MRLEQTVTVRLGPGDVSQLKSRHALTVACVCGQHITLAWDGKPAPVRPAALKHACEVCGRSFDTARALGGHLGQAHRPEKLVAKPKAKPRANGKGKQHVVVAEKSLRRTHQCGECEAKFTTSQGVALHVLRVHRGKGPQKGFTLKPKEGTA